MKFIELTELDYDNMCSDGTPTYVAVLVNPEQISHVSMRDVANGIGPRGHYVEVSESHRRVTLVSMANGKVLTVYQTPWEIEERIQ